MPIPAECYSDDHILEATFDAEPWFAHASRPQILALATCGWGGDYPADEVAIYMADYDQGVGKVFSYLELVGAQKKFPRL